jgi:hypothetical protein
VVHIPRNLESGEVSLTESPSGRLEFKLSHIRLTGSAALRSEYCSDIALFDHKLLNKSSGVANKFIQKKGNKRQGYKDD